MIVRTRQEYTILFLRPRRGRPVCRVAVHTRRAPRAVKGRLQ